MTNNTTQQHPDHSFLLLVLSVLALITILMLSGCKSVEYVPVEKTVVHTELTHDTIISRDTITNNTTTIIRELDSLQMAQYGITLANQQKAWLIDRQQLQQQISNLKQAHTEAIHDTVTTPQLYPVTVEVPAELTKWQQTRIFMGDSFMIILAVLAVCIAINIYRHFKP